jgi:hypothetical protein
MHHLLKCCQYIYTCHMLGATKNLVISTVVPTGVRAILLK